MKADSWYRAEDAVTNAGGIVYIPNRARRLWRLRQLYWRARVALGYKASRTGRLGY